MMDIIAALSTAPGIGAIACVRISGNGCFKLLGKICGEHAISKLINRQATLLRLHKVDRPDCFLDDALIIPYVGPNSYTGEDVVEIFCHGGNLISQTIISELTTAGARISQPGEFSYRAFLNNKLDLVQAESINAMIHADTEATLSLSKSHYSGQFSRRIKELRSEIVDILSLLELELDFTEDDVELAERTSIENRISQVIQWLNETAKSYSAVQLIRGGLHVIIVGKPNVGKSSLLNTLIKRERAIVSSIPGTTRDYIQEEVQILGKKYVFCDTAGIHATDDILEFEGINRSTDRLKQSHIIFFMIDGSQRLTKDDWEVRQSVFDLHEGDASTRFLLVNKSDLSMSLTQQELESFATGFTIHQISCKTGYAFDQLIEGLDSVHEHLTQVSRLRNDVLVNTRQLHAIQSAQTSFVSALDHYRENLSQEFVSSDLRAGVASLAELVGDIRGDEILGNVFSNFCIGK